MAMPLPQRLSLVTLGVSDLPRSRQFYERLGFKAAEASDKVAFYDMGGIILGLFGRQDLADDAGLDARGSGFRGSSLSINLDSETAVDAALDFIRQQGGSITQPARKVFWGGYSGYFADPDGHLWEVAYNPFWPLDSEGRVQIQSAPVTLGTATVDSVKK